jgi:hypothetical protein
VTGDFVITTRLIDASRLAGRELLRISDAELLAILERVPF